MRKTDFLLMVLLIDIFSFFFSLSQTSESAAPSLRSANLSALKKRWEQAGNIDPAKTVPPPSQSSSRSRPPALSRPAPIAEHPAALKSPGPLTTQGGQLTASRVRKSSNTSQGEEQRGMERDELTHSERPEKLEEQVPTSPCASYEKPRVPLNNLKMKFERGEDAIGKVGIDRFTGEEHMPNTFATQCFLTAWYDSTRLVRKVRSHCHVFLFYALNVLSILNQKWDKMSVLFKVLY